MKEKFYLVLSPINLIFVIVLDVACAYFDYLSVSMLIKEVKGLNIAFVGIMLFASVVAVLTTVQTFKNGVKFYDDRVEFTGIDTDNEFKYCDIERVEFQKDDAVSFRKNFVDRFSHIIIYLKDERVVTITLGLTTKRTLNKIVNDLKSRV